MAIKADLSRPVEVARLSDETQQRLSILDIVVANAADMIVKSPMDCSEEDYDRTVDTNAQGLAEAHRKAMAS